MLKISSNAWKYTGSDVPIPDKINELDNWINPMPTGISRITNKSKVWLGYNRIEKGLFKVLGRSISGPHFEELKILHFFYFLKQTEIEKKNKEEIIRTVKRILDERIKFYVIYREKLVSAVDDIRWL